MADLIEYQSLKQDILDLKEKTFAKFQAVLIQSHWDIGQRLARVSLLAQNQNEILCQLAQDTEIEYTALSRALQFYRAWPEMCPVEAYPELSWSHYKALLPIKSGENRERLASEADQKGWPVRMLREKVKSGGAPLESDQVFDSVSGEMPQLKRRDSKLFVYEAKITKIVDGDTIDVLMDLGFRVSTEQRLRLRGIDCPEMSTLEGELAKNFVIDILAGVQSVVIQTFRTDLYGRYVADVFFLKGSEDREEIFSTGKLLNQVLLDAGHAQLM